MTTLEQLKEEIAEAIAVRNRSILVNTGEVRVDSCHIADAQAALDVLTPHIIRYREGLDKCGGIASQKLSYDLIVEKAKQALENNPLSEVKDES